MATIPAASRKASNRNTVEALGYVETAEVLTERLIDLFGECNLNTREIQAVSIKLLECAQQLNRCSTKLCQTRC